MYLADHYPEAGWPRAFLSVIGPVIISGCFIWRRRSIRPSRIIVVHTILLSGCVRILISRPGKEGSGRDLEGGSASIPAFTFTTRLRIGCVFGSRKGTFLTRPARQLLLPRCYQNTPYQEHPGAPWLTPNSRFLVRIGPLGSAQVGPGENS